MQKMVTACYHFAKYPYWFKSQAYVQMVSFLLLGIGAHGFVTHSDLWALGSSGLRPTSVSAEATWRSAPRSWAAEAGRPARGIAVRQGDRSAAGRACPRFGAGILIFDSVVLALPECPNWATRLSVASRRLLGVACQRFLRGFSEAFEKLLGIF